MHYSNGYMYCSSKLKLRVSFILFFYIRMLIVFTSLFDLYGHMLLFIFVQVGQKEETGLKSHSTPAGLFFQHAGHR